MTRPIRKCPTCGRSVALVNDRYPNIRTTLRPRYPKPYDYYADHNETMPANYCPGSTQRPKDMT